MNDDEYYSARLEGWLANEIHECLLMGAREPAVQIIKERGVEIAPGTWRIREIMTYSEYKNKTAACHLEWRSGGLSVKDRDAEPDVTALIDRHRDALSALVNSMDEWFCTKKWDLSNHFSIEEERIRWNAVAEAARAARNILNEQ